MSNKTKKYRPQYWPNKILATIIRHMTIFSKKWVDYNEFNTKNPWVINVTFWGPTLRLIKLAFIL